MARDITPEAWDIHQKSMRTLKRSATYRLSIDALSKLDQMSASLGRSKTEVLERSIDLMASHLLDSDPDRVVILRCVDLLQRVAQASQSK